MFNFPHYSRYSKTDSISFANVDTVGLYLVPDIIANLKSSDLRSIKIDSEFAGRPDLIANSEYGTPYYSWIIIMYNRPLNPIGWPKIGDRILIPTDNIVNDIIFNRNNNT